MSNLGMLVLEGVYQWIAQTPDSQKRPPVQEHAMLVKLFVLFSPFLPTSFTRFAMEPDEALSCSHYASSPGSIPGFNSRGLPIEYTCS